MSLQQTQQKTALRKFQIVKGQYKGLCGEGVFNQGYVVLAIPSVKKVEILDHFHPKQVISYGEVKGGISLSEFLWPSLVNVPYFSRKKIENRIEGEKCNYLEINQNVVKLHVLDQKDSKVDCKGSPRGTIRGFSKKSRSRMIQRMAQLEQYPNVWLDLTFADDVMDGLSVTERARKSSEILNEFKKAIERSYPHVAGVWRREWEDRKSGPLQGKLIPHFHTLLCVPYLEEAHYKKICMILAEKWVDLTGTMHPRAKAVALHPKSYRWIGTKKMAQIYVSKYVAKEQHDIEVEDSLGRFWGYIGKPAFAETDYQLLTESEEKLLRRLLRRYADKRMSKMIRSHSGFWVLIGRGTVERMIKYIKELNYEKAMSQDEYF